MHIKMLVMRMPAGNANTGNVATKDGLFGKHAEGSVRLVIFKQLNQVSFSVKKVIVDNHALLPCPALGTL